MDDIYRYSHGFVFNVVRVANIGCNIFPHLRLLLDEAASIIQLQFITIRKKVPQNVLYTTFLRYKYTLRLNTTGKDKYVYIYIE